MTAEKGTAYHQSCGNPPTRVDLSARLLSRKRGERRTLASCIRSASPSYLMDRFRCQSADSHIFAGEPRMSRGFCVLSASCFMFQEKPSECRVRVNLFLRSHCLALAAFPVPAGAQRKHRTAPRDVDVCRSGVSIHTAVVSLSLEIGSC